MKYLTGGCSEQNVAEFRRLGVGLMLTPAIFRRDTYGLEYAVDTGCYKNPDGFDLDDYLARLDDWRERNGPPLFATAPDVVGDPNETWRRSAPILPVLRAHGHRAAFVAQDGISRVEWDAFDCLFVGGTDAWKLSEAAYGLADKARRRGKWVHLGRVNSGIRYAAAKASGAYDSADGNFVGFGPDVNLPKVARWLERGRSQVSLWEDAR